MQLLTLSLFSFYKRLCLIVLLLYRLLPVHAQYEEANFKRYTVKQGLSDNYVTAIQQDEWGYLWVATDAGLNRFDGNSFKKYFQGSSLALASNTVLRLKLFGKHKLGILGTGGFQVLDTRNNDLRNYFIPNKTAFTIYQNNTWDAQQVNHSYYLTTNTGFYELDENGEISFRFDAYQPSDVNKQTVRYGRDIFLPASDNPVIYTQEDNIALFDTRERKIREFKKSDWMQSPFAHPPEEEGGPWVCKAQISAHEFLFFYGARDQLRYYNHQTKKQVLTDLPPNTAEGLGWDSRVIQVNDSVFAVNNEVNGFYTFTLDRRSGKVRWSPVRHLMQYKVNCLYVDRDNRLWVGTTLGLLQQKLNPPFLQTRVYRDASEDSISGWFTSVHRYKDKIFVGRYSRSYGILILDTALASAGRKIAFFGGGNAWNEVRSVQRYYDDTLWIGTTAGLLWLDTRTERYGKLDELFAEPALKSFAGIMAPLKNDGSAWMCNFMNGAIARYDTRSRQFKFITMKTEPALPFWRVKQVAYDPYGDVWISGHGLTRWSTSKQVFDTVIMEYSGLNKFNEDILTMSADPTGSLWLHNARNGLLEYNIQQKKFQAYTIHDGLPSSEIRSLSPVVQNKLWIGCNSQLALFDTKTKVTMLFDESDGLPESRPTGRIIDYDAAGDRFFLGCNDELLFFPRALPGTRTGASGLMLQELVVNNKKIFFNPAGEIRLQPGDDNLALYFSIIDFEAGDDYQFAYQLNNSNNWISTGGQRMINLTGLSAGHYTVAVRATAKSGEQYRQELRFSIAPPFWKRTWFYITAGALLLALAFGLYRYRIGHVRQKANLDKLLAQTEMKALHAQMNPHFVFNSLNSISEMILNNENKDATHYLSKFAHLIRVTLDQSGKSFVSLRNTMDYLQRYIEMEQIRNSHFTFTMSAAPELDTDEIQLPPMLIQPFIENSIWHGITDDRKDITIRVQFEQDQDQLVCTIEDDGIGIDRTLQEQVSAGKTHRPVGISNIRNRIRLLNEKHNLQCSVTIRDKSAIPGADGTGTVVTLRLPMELKEDE